MNQSNPLQTPPTNSGMIGLLSRLIVVLMLVLVLGYFGYLAITLGPDIKTLGVADFLGGEKRILSPADMRGAPLRVDDRVFVLTTQSERIIPMRLRMTGTPQEPRQVLHADMWAFDTSTAKPLWRKRLRTFEDRDRIDFEMLGADGNTIWVMMRAPIGVSMRDGSIIADPQRIEAANPNMAGKLVIEPGYVAFGGQGLQLTLNDSTQWVVHGDTLKAEPRETAPKNPPGLLALAKEVVYSSRLQMRGMTVNNKMWLGVLTDDEAKAYQADPVIPGRDPKESRGALYDVLEAQHFPQPLYDVQPRPYRVWSAKVEQVSAAPKGWPKELPDKWGTRPKFSDYKALPESPPFLQAGLLYDGYSPNPYWFLEPDSVLVMYNDKLGAAGRLKVARVSGPAGRVVWDAPLPIANMKTSMPGKTVLAFTGNEPNAAYDPDDEESPEHLQKLLMLDVPTGTVSAFDLSTESVRPDAHQPTL